MELGAQVASRCLAAYDAAVPPARVAHLLFPVQRPNIPRRALALLPSNPSADALSSNSRGLPAAQSAPLQRPLTEPRTCFN